MFMQIPAEPPHNTNHLKLDTYKDVKAGNAENTSTEAHEEFAEGLASRGQRLYSMGG